MNLVPTIHRRLDNLTRTAKKLKNLLARARDLPPTHEFRLSTKLHDIQMGLQDLIAQTQTIASVHQEEPRP